MPCFLHTNSRTILLAAGCTMNAEFCQPFLTFLHFPYLQFSRLFFFSIFIVLVGFFSWGCFFFLFLLASKLNCYSVRMSVKIHFNLNGISIRHDL